MVKIPALAVANENVVAAAVAALADKEQIAGHRIGHGHKAKTVDSFFPVIQAVPIIAMFFYVSDKIGLLALRVAGCPSAIMPHQAFSIRAFSPRIHADQVGQIGGQNEVSTLIAGCKQRLMTTGDRFPLVVEKKNIPFIFKALAVETVKERPSDGGPSIVGKKDPQIVAFVIDMQVQAVHIFALINDKSPVQQIVARNQRGDHGYGDDDLFKSHDSILSFIGRIKPARPCIAKPSVRRSARQTARRAPVPVIKSSFLS